MQRRTGLSKSRITLYEQCPKRLWLSVHRPELAVEEASVTASFAAGHQVGKIACALYPGGHMIEATAGLATAVAETARLITSGWREPIFEATFAHEDVLVRVDLMLPSGRGWHVAEVKSTTGVKPYHVADLATQLWVMQACEVEISTSSIRHLDRNFVLEREGHYDGLFADSFVDDDVAPLIATRGAVVEGARETLAGDEPVCEIGAHCDDPFTCSFKEYCGRHRPPAPQWPVSLLPDTAGKKIARDWIAKGIDDLTKVPADAVTAPKLARVYDATVTGMTFHDPQAIAAETADWAFPRIFLDFETIQFAVPRWVGTKPWQQVPFQFSAHIVEADGRISHQEFLSCDGSDPRRACAEALTQLPVTGAVIAYNMAFERGCLRGLAARFPDLAPALESLAARLVDLLPVVRRHYYHPDMRGSWSIKAVLPTVVPELGYEGLADVKSGTDAQAGYVEAIDPAATWARRAEVRQALLDYCRRDTEGVMVVLERLSRASGAAGEAQQTRAEAVDEAV